MKVEPSRIPSSRVNCHVDPVLVLLVTTCLFECAAVFSSSVSSGSDRFLFVCVVSWRCGCAVSSSSESDDSSDSDVVGHTCVVCPFVLSASANVYKLTF